MILSRENKMTVEKMKQILTDEVPWEEVKKRKNKGIYEFYEQNGKSLGISYEDIDGEKDVYIYNIFLGDDIYINISNRGTKDNPITNELLNELVLEWNIYEENYHNKVQRILSTTDELCFIIKTKGDNDFWYWQISKATWDKFWKDKNPAFCDNITEEAANEFVNSDECSHCGCSSGNYATIEEAVADYLKIKEKN